MTFAILTLFGKDPGHDFGIRLAGLVGFIVCVLAWLALGQYKELKH
jgi:GPH family glycoside/pentoside/hexuronide:cation symporter